MGLLLYPGAAVKGFGNRQPFHDFVRRQPTSAKSLGCDGNFMQASEGIYNKISRLCQNSIRNAASR